MDFNHTININSIELYPIAATDGVSPQMAIGAMPTRPALLIRIKDTDECFGWGEVWANFPPRANLHKTHIIEDVIAPALNGSVFVEPREIQQNLRDKLSTYFLHIGQLQVFEHILAGIDIALWDLVLRKHNQNVVDFFGLNNNSAPCYASSINAEDLEKRIPIAANSGQKHFKIKIGFQKDAGCALVGHATSLCPPDCHVMIDSNQSWSIDQAVKCLNALEQYSPFFAEEPIAANAPLAQWEKLASSTTIPLAGGENIYGIDSFISMANAGMAVLQPDVAKWGGVTGAFDLNDALPANVRLWPHFMGTALGQMASLAITAVIGGDAVCEVDVNTNPLRTELCGESMNINDGCIKLTPGIGLVPEPETERLEAFSI